MHFEILVKDQSGKMMLDALVPKIIGVEHTFKVHAYKGIGRIPQGLKPKSDPQKRILLDQLPKLIQGYGRMLASYPPNCPAFLVVICDLDSRCLHLFRQELLALLDRCVIHPETLFCIAIQEIEAWYLGDRAAIKAAFPHARSEILGNKEIRGTWEELADAIFPRGSQNLARQGWQAVGQEKSIWAAKMTPFMDVESNLSPSFIYFRDRLRRLCCC